MKAKKNKRFDWNAMDQGQKLGYVWLLLFIILILSTGATILTPAVKKWLEEEGGEKKGARLNVESPVYAFADIKDATHGFHGAFHRACQSAGVSHPASIG